MQISKSFLIRLLAVVVLFSAGMMAAPAQIRFTLIPVKAGGGVTEEAAAAASRKVEQILARNSAAGPSEGNDYAVRAELTVTDELQSSGLVRNITSVSGELTLTAVNTSDGSMYHSVTVPLKAAVKSTDSSKAVLALAKAIKPTDAVYTRFVRVAGERIEALEPAETKEPSETPAESDNRKNADAR